VLPVCVYSVLVLTQQRPVKRTYASVGVATSTVAETKYALFNMVHKVEKVKLSL
jgi:hypothetical protein